MRKPLLLLICCGTLGVALFAGGYSSQETERRAWIDGQGPGWVELGSSDFVDVNGEPGTWRWEDSIFRCTGQPIGVIRTKKTYTNFELSLEWRHLRSAGNSGVFVWVPKTALENLEPGKLPDGGIEVQMLDHGYAEEYQARTGNKPDWFSTNGDIFAVGKSTLKPFPPLSPNGRRSFPRENRSRGFGEWNHYYVRAINGEVRLWVNGAEVSGGSDAKPQSGYLALEAEGSPIEFKKIRIRELP